MRTDAGRPGPWPGLRELDAAAFVADLDALMGVYRAAMGVAAVQLPGRRAIMEAHTAYPGFRALVVTRMPPDAAGGAATGETAAGPGAVMAFAYGFHCGRGQWWHDLVRSALISSAGHAAAARWLDDAFEVAEVHVRPEDQRHGIGRRLLFRLTGDRAEHTAVLSTMDADSPARRLYRSLGFTDLLTGYRFSGAPVPYAVMGAALPLRGASS